MGGEEEEEEERGCRVIFVPLPLAVLLKVCQFCNVTPVMKAASESASLSTFCVWSTFGYFVVRLGTISDIILVFFPRFSLFLIL